ncbi:MAG: hypothetical protein IJ221_06610 [Oscillibacter sp.]|nr:hypothetical protein [Oscillibacter sp.]
MNVSHRSWLRAALAVLLCALTVCGGAVYLLDPCLYYRLPERAVYFDERLQNPGIIRNCPAETVLLGTSMAANYHKSQIEELWGGTALRITVPGAYLSELDETVDLLFREQSPGRILLALDMNTLTRDETDLTGSLPEYLYDTDPFNDARYLLSKDSLYYCGYALLERRQGSALTVDDGFTWTYGVWWNHQEAIREYTRPEMAEEPLPADAYDAAARANLAVIERWLTDHPETEFHIFFSPYSILYWDRCQRRGETEAVLSVLEQACTALLSHENVTLYAPLLDREIVDDLDHYCDYVHHSPAVCGTVLEKLRAGEDRITPSNQAQLLSDWRDFVVHYDYEKLWDIHYWEAWNAAHGVG